MYARTPLDQQLLHLHDLGQAKLRMWECIPLQQRGVRGRVPTTHIHQVHTRMAERAALWLEMI